MAWVDGVSAGNFTDADRNSNIQMMLLDLYNTESWDRRAASAAIGAAWAFAECNPYFQWTGGFLYAGLFAWTSAQITAGNVGSTGALQMDFFVSAQNLWDGSQVYGSPSFWRFYTGSLPTSAYNTVKQYTDVFVACYGNYRLWSDFSQFRTKAEQYAEKIYNNFDRYLAGYFTPAWLYMEMSKRKKGGGKLYL